MSTIKDALEGKPSRLEFLRDWLVMGAATFALALITSVIVS